MIDPLRGLFFIFFQLHSALLRYAFVVRRHTTAAYVNDCSHFSNGSLALARENPPLHLRSVTRITACPCNHRYWTTCIHTYTRLNDSFDILSGPFHKQEILRPKGALFLASPFINMHGFNPDNHIYMPTRLRR